MDKHLTRRRFIKLTLLFGSSLVAGCRPKVEGFSLDSPTTNPDDVVHITLAPDLKFTLQDEAVDYSGSSVCNHTTIQGSVRDTTGSPMGNMTVRILAEDGSFAGDAATGLEGTFQVNVADEVVSMAYRVQLMGPDGSSLSDVIIAEAIPSCDLNVMTLDFVPQ